MGQIKKFHSDRLDTTYIKTMFEINTNLRDKLTKVSLITEQNMAMT